MYLFFTQTDLFYQLVNSLIFQFVLFILYYCSKLNNYFRNILFTVLIVEFLVQYFASFNLWYKLDILTIYWFVWQFISLTLYWIRSVLLPPIRIIEQGSFCMFAALGASMWHNMFFRYLPLAFNLSLLWIFSIIDM